MRDDIKWFFVWTGINGYTTTICAWNRRRLIKKVEADIRQKWKNIYRQGGRAIKCKVTPIGKGKT